MVVPTILITVLAFALRARSQGGLSCSIPSNPNSYSSQKLPDPFTFINGTRLSNIEQWACRKEEIKTLLQRYELGPLPPGPSSLVASIPSENRLKIDISYNGKSIALNVSIKLPPGGGDGPFPAIILLGNTTIPQNAGVAQIQLDAEDLAKTENRGRGRFYDLYGTGSETGALLAWVWGVSRLIDALETIPAQVTHIDASRIGIAGCGRYGKATLIAGGFEERLKLSIPQDAGTGGTGCWRIVGELKKNGTKTEDAGAVISGSQWFTQQFSRYTGNVNQLPYDHHMLAGLISPRGLFITENSGLDWLGPVSTYGCSIAGRLIFQTLGTTPSFGFSQTSHGEQKCGVQDAEQPYFDSFISKFLLGKQVDNAVIFRTDRQYGFDLSRWVDWKFPDFLSPPSK